MKTITAKEFQVRHSAILKRVAQGDEYQVTFHRKPLVKLLPVRQSAVSGPPAGSREAFLRSLQYTVASKGTVHDLPYKELRRRMVAKKYGGQ